MRDSAAILHYLEANYRDAPSLTPASRDDIRSAEALLARLNPEILSIQYGLEDEIRKSDSERDEGRIATGRATLVAALERLERRLATVPWLVGGAMSLYDVILACNLLPARPPARFVEQSPLWRFFADHLALDGDRPAIEAWVDRVIAHDAKL
jgi:glutathione S-transferase